MEFEDFDQSLGSDLSSVNLMNNNRNKGKNLDRPLSALEQQ